MSESVHQRMAKIVAEIRERSGVDPKVPLTYRTVKLKTDPIKVRELLRTTTVGKRMVAEGADLAMTEPSAVAYYGEVHLLATDDNLDKVYLRGWQWDYTKQDEGWTYKVEVMFSYRDEKDTTGNESVMLYLSENGYGSLGTNISMMYYAETGYEGHGGSFVPNAGDPSSHEFLNVVEGLLL